MKLLPGGLALPTDARLGAAVRTFRRQPVEVLVAGCAVDSVHDIVVECFKPVVFDGAAVRAPNRKPLLGGVVQLDVGQRGLCGYPQLLHIFIDSRGQGFFRMS
jgi:hypothetical protein